MVAVGDCVFTDVAMPCSAWARHVVADPVGTAGSYDGIVLVETPPPWPRDPADVPALRDAAAVLASHAVRLQLVRPADDAAMTRRVVSFHREEDDWFVRFGRHETNVAAGEEADAAIALGRAEVPHDFDSDEIDVLVCTHGTRDSCCGSAGTRLAAELSADGAGGPPDRVNVWRTSHLGGHRFAPTAVVLPEGTCWAFLDQDTLVAIVTRACDVDDVLGAYRGCLAFGPRPAQALERVAFRETGWSWLRRPRRASSLGDDRFSVESVLPTGDRQSWSGLVVEGRKLPVPVCRAPVDGTQKQEAELVVAAYARAG